MYEINLLPLYQKKYMEMDFDLKRIGYYEKTANKIKKHLIDQQFALKLNPEMGASIEAKTGIPSDIRYLIAKPYMQFYWINHSNELPSENGGIEMLTMLHLKSSYVAHLF